MLRSMYSAISGLKNFQTQLDVIGNNIANVNTFGFKKSRISFSDLVSQQLAGASAPTALHGGINPQQVGTGSQLAGIDTIDTQGATQNTGRPLDFEINGDGYFIVKNGPDTYYTRAGDFYLDTAGNLVNAQGFNVLGFGVDANGSIDQGRLTKLGISDGLVTQPTTDSLTISGNLNAKAIESAGGSSMGFNVYDSNGVEHDAQITFQGDAADEAKDNSGLTFVKSVNFSITADGSTPATQTGTVTFKDDGSVDTITLDGAAGQANGLSFSYDDNGTPGTATVGLDDIDFGDMTSYDDPATADVVGDKVSLSDFSVDSAGRIYGILSNGDLELFGQIATSQFNNPAGLNKVGGSLYSQSSNSGAPVVGAPGDDGSGSLSVGALEMSNVDLSEEFTSMIEAQRGFQANARVITTSDSILQELVDLKRQ